MEERYAGYLSLEPRATPRRDYELTPRMLDVFRCLAYGMDVRGAAESCGIGYETAKTYVAEGRGRLAAKTTTHAVALLFRAGVLH